MTAWLLRGGTASARSVDGLRKFLAAVRELVLVSWDGVQDASRWLTEIDFCKDRQVKDGVSFKFRSSESPQALTRRVASNHDACCPSFLREREIDDPCNTSVEKGLQPKGCHISRQHVSPRKVSLFRW